MIKRILNGKNNLNSVKNLFYKVVFGLQGRNNLTGKKEIIETFSYSRTRNIIFKALRKNMINERHFKQLIITNLLSNNEERRAIALNLKNYKEGRTKAFHYKIYFELFYGKIFQSLLLFSIYTILLYIEN